MHQAPGPRALILMPGNTAGEDRATEKRFCAGRPEEQSCRHQRHEDGTEAFKAIKAKVIFISRDDRPGIAELDLWKAAAIDIDRAKGP